MTTKAQTQLQTLNALFKTQAEIATLIAKALPNLKSTSEQSWSKTRVTGRLKLLQTHWDTFQAGHKKILGLREKSSDDVIAAIEAHDYMTQNEYLNVQESFLDALDVMETFLEKVTAASVKDGTALAETSFAVTPTAGATYSHRLPKIELPTFDGHYANWIPFREMFISMVGSSTVLSNVEKLHYLKTSLSGHAAARISTIPLMGVNFSKVWDHLMDYYDNERIMLQSTIRDLFNIPSVRSGTATELERLFSAFIQSQQMLETLQSRGQSSDNIVIQLILTKVDPITVSEWEKSLGNTKDLPRWEQFSTFMTSRIRSLEAISFSVSNSSSTSSSSTAKRDRPARSHHVSRTNRPQHSQSRTATRQSAQPTASSHSCVLCSASHYLASCPEYKAKTPQQRRELLIEKSLCFNCLGNHRITNCQSTNRCFHCGQQHHTTTHFHCQQQPIQTTLPIVQSSNGVNVNHASTSADVPRKPVLSATAKVFVTSIHGELVPARLLLDQGSEVSFISERLTQLLNLRRKRAALPLVGIGAQQSVTSRHSVSLKVSPHFNSSIEVSITAFVLPKLTASLPAVDVSLSSWSHLNGLILADPQYTTPGAVDIIIGADSYGKIIESNVVKGDSSEPIAQQSILGWIISGPVDSSRVTDPVHTYHCSIDHDLNDALQRFWTQEETSSKSTTTLRSPDDEACEQHFVSTHSRTESGRYVVKLPFKASATNLGDSRTPALRMLQRMLRVFRQKPRLHQDYTAFLSEYESLGHMIRVPKSNLELNRVCYLPHHGVHRDTSSTTKLRVVFNGSSRTSSGHSLNDLLHTGEQLQTDLADVLMWFRSFPFVFATDIQKMYRQIAVHSDDWDLQRILWVDKNGDVSAYQLTTVTYGLGCAPFLALRAIQQLVADEGHKFPLAVPLLINGRYVDDIFGGADTIEQCRAIIQQLTELCMAGGFPLQKWVSNDSNVLQDIPTQHRAKMSSIHIDVEPLIRTLGLSWQPASDTFHFAAEFKDSPITKRSVLSQISQVFDPLGFLCPVVVVAKMFMQELWLKQLDWDEELSVDMATQWKKFQKQLKDISLVTIPRWLGITSSAMAIELHGFSDASQLAMAAVVYTRVLLNVDDAVINLVCAKTRVAPLKRLTIPRLELAAAALLARLIVQVQRVLNLNTVPVHLWTDSSVALTWITSHPSKWKDFVRNRVCLIHELVPKSRWHFVPGADNPADCASRGVTPSELAHHKLWWSGPAWLTRHSTFWPTEIQSSHHNFDVEERSAQATIATQPLVTEYWELFSKSSTLSKLVKITANVKRVISRLRKVPQSSFVYPLTPGDLNEATLFWIKQVQQNEFASELKLLTAGNLFPRSHSLAKLTPFLDQHGLLRVGGRLENSTLKYDAKHPCILPRHSHLSTLIIDDAHSRTLHGGTQVTLSLIREKYWIVGGRAPVRAFVYRCVKCARHRAVRAQQLMGQLPTARATQSRSFLHTGVDYAGPVAVKTWGGRGAKISKGYIALFVCFSTSAIHLEFVTDYSTETFIAAFHRFTARRGLCSCLYSDCGTNFVGASRELKRLFDQASRSDTKIAQILAKDQVMWKFNPPASPHFGGKWEAGVKSVKHHLNRVIGDTLLTMEEFVTLLTRIEAVVNSRPLCPLSDDPSDLAALTPGHFIIGTALNSIPEPSVLDINSSRLSRWQHLQQLLQHFWKRWSAEVLQRFLASSRWLHANDQIHVGSLVLISDERYPPSKWPLGRVVELHPGADGLTRVVTLKTSSTTLQRPIAKLCLLPVPTAAPSPPPQQPKNFN